MNKKPLFLIAPFINASDQVLILKEVLGVEIKTLNFIDVQKFFYTLSGRDRFYEIGHYFSTAEDYYFYIKVELPNSEVEFNDSGLPISSYRWPANLLDDAKKISNDINFRISYINLISSGYLKIPEYHIAYLMDDNNSFKAIAHLGGEIASATNKKFEINHPKLLNYIKDLDKQKIPSYIQSAVKYLDLSYYLNENMQFLSILIAFEILFNTGKDQISYTLARCTAVLIGETEDDSQKIFDKMKKAYNLRSKLVHNGEAEFFQMLEYVEVTTEYLKRSISCLLVKFPQKKELFSNLNAIGFGDSPYKLSNGV
ncbi:HEPN domain-containing protein [Leptospira sp. 85282-16]|uniref:HEPN domain-containing protein n=1 Tax=Leptospira sp. 85282-16 TaxID=2971256 RepID=UPI0021BFF918|nr:HEPN domain-containing protein [Leptospira sp. 85282-16]MCT8335807.1 HEPN domain-containing protein [Leptospira sp. 85282-16]